MNFSYSIAFKSISLSCTLNGFFTHTWFCNVMRWSFGIYWSTELCRSFNYETFHYMISKKSHSLILPLTSSKNSLSVGKPPSSEWQIQVFQNSHLHLTGRIFFLKWQTHFIFEKCLPDIQTWKKLFYITLSNKKWHFLKNVPMLIHSSNSCPRLF